MTDITSFEDLKKELNKKIKNVMSTSVSKVARQTLKEHIVTDVYEQYQPSEEGYERTGGLLQDINIDTIMIDDNTLSVRSTRHDGLRDIGYIIEYGVGYDWQRSRIAQMQPYPRPFHENTYLEMSKGSFEKALVSGLKAEGLYIS